jgi:hypothetical protein
LQVFNTLEVVFNYLFLVELVINLAAHWFFDFFEDAWNIFDLVVVVISTVAMYVEAFPIVSDR